MFQRLQKKITRLTVTQSETSGRMTVVFSLPNLIPVCLPTLPTYLYLHTCFLSGPRASETCVVKFINIGSSAVSPSSLTPNLYTSVLGRWAKVFFGSLFSSVVCSGIRNVDSLSLSLSLSVYCIYINTYLGISDILHNLPLFYCFAGCEVICICRN